MGHSPGYREPELVVDDSIVDDDDMVPDLMPGNDAAWEDNLNSTFPTDVNNNWATDGGYSTWDDPNTVAAWTKGTSGGLDFDSMDYTNASTTTSI